jgi:hypothetical protein
MDLFSKNLFCDPIGWARELKRTVVFVMFSVVGLLQGGLAVAIMWLACLLPNDTDFPWMRHLLAGYLFVLAGLSQIFWMWALRRVVGAYEAALLKVPTAD